MWPKNGNLAGGVRNWNDAIDFANNVTLCGYTDWRLPNVNELESIITIASDHYKYTWLLSNGFYNVQNYGYWSSTSYANLTNAAWVVGILFLLAIDLGTILFYCPGGCSRAAFNIASWGGLVVGVLAVVALAMALRRKGAQAANA